LSIRNSGVGSNFRPRVPGQKKFRFRQKITKSLWIDTVGRTLCIKIISWELQKFLTNLAWSTVSVDWIRERNECASVMVITHALSSIGVNRRWQITAAAFLTVCRSLRCICDGSAFITASTSLASIVRRICNYFDFLRATANSLSLQDDETSRADSEMCWSLDLNCTVRCLSLWRVQTQKETRFDETNSLVV